MRYLIDTNIFLYSIKEQELLDNNVRSILDDYENSLYISMESLKELVLFYRKQKKKPKEWKDETALIKSVENSKLSLKILPVKKEHILTYAKMQINQQENHKDPTDHIIIAQAITEKIPLISSDRKFSYYTTQKLDFIFNDK